GGGWPGTGPCDTPCWRRECPETSPLRRWKRQATKPNEPWPWPGSGPSGSVFPSRKPPTGACTASYSGGGSGHRWPGRPAARRSAKRSLRPRSPSRQESLATALLGPYIVNSRDLRSPPVRTRQLDDSQQAIPRTNREAASETAEVALALP